MPFLSEQKLPKKRAIVMESLPDQAELLPVAHGVKNAVVRGEAIKPTDAPIQDDNRFRALLSQQAWFELPLSVRKRFSKKVKPGASVVYTGTVSHMVMRPLGWLIAQLARIIGAPLPVDPRCQSKASVVAITDDAHSGGQIWTRLYSKRAGFPQMVHSVKAFAGPTGLEEHIGYGIGMALTLHVEKGALLFKSDHFFLTIFGKRVCLPRVLSPGALTVGHHDLAESFQEGAFAFTLELTHPIAGLLLYQRVVFHDMQETPLKGALQ